MCGAGSLASSLKLHQGGLYGEKHVRISAGACRISGVCGAGILAEIAPRGGGRGSMESKM